MGENPKLNESDPLIMDKLTESRRLIQDSEDRAKSSLGSALKDFEKAQDNVYPENIFGMARILLQVQPWIVKSLALNFIRNFQESIRCNWTDQAAMTDPSHPSARDSGLTEMCQVYSVMMTQAPMSPQTVAFRDTFSEEGIKLTEMSLN